MALLAGAARQHLIDNSGAISKLAFKATVWVFFILAVLCTLARCAIRAFTQHRPSLDDFFVLLGSAALVVAWAVLLKTLDDLYIAEALNDHPGEFEVTLSELLDLLATSKWSKILVAMVWLSIFSIKGAFLCFFNVLIRQLSRKIHIYFWVVVFFNAGCWLTLSFIDWAVCPYVGMKAAQCSEHFDHNISLAVNIASAVLDIICDSMIIRIPILVLSLSHMSTSQKISYAGILCLSMVMIITALIRLIGSVATTHKTNYGTAPIWGTFWQMIESCVAVIMACFFTLRSLLAKGNSASPPGPASRPNHDLLVVGTLWERLLLTLRFRSKYRRSPSNTAEEEEVDADNKNRLGEDKVEQHLIPTADITRPTLAFSQLRTLFKGTASTQVAIEPSLMSRGAIDVVSEFDLIELDYHQVIRQQAPSSAGIGFVRSGGVWK